MIQAHPCSTGQGWACTLPEMPWVAFLLAASIRMYPVASLQAQICQDCALVPTGLTWGEVIAAGCTEPVKQLLSSMNGQELINLFDKLGLYTAPSFPVETLSSTKPDSISDPLAYITGQQKDPGTGAILQVSPLQMALAAATLSNQGTLPAPRLVMSVDTPQSGWVTLPLTLTATAGSPSLICQSGCRSACIR